MPSVYDFEALSITGQPVPLSHYKGQVMLIVNTASACGFTPQFAGLEALHKAYGPRGLAVLGRTRAATRRSPASASSTTA